VPGEVFVQTCSLEHPAILAACGHDEDAPHAIVERKEAGYPARAARRLIADRRR
jgi:primosomal protein N'